MSRLTAAQALALKTAINANPTWAAFPMSDDGYLDLASALSAEASPVFNVWSTNADVMAVRAAIIGANLTPVDVPDGTQLWLNRCMQCQGKQLSLQLLLPFSGTVSGADANFRAALQDALQGVRAGPGGAVVDAGWAGVRNAMSRRAKFFEKILADTATGDGSTKALSATMTLQGNALADDVRQARNS